MQYKVSVPLVNHYEFRDDFLKELPKLGASRVFLCEGRGFLEPETVANSIEILKKSVDFYRNAGYEVGVWISTIGHGSALVGVDGEPLDTGFTNIKGFDGRINEDSFCPLDENFRNAVCNYVAALAGTNPDMIMLDDDYRMSHRQNVIGCWCEHHNREYFNRTGEDLTGERALEHFFTGGKNPYRDAFLSMMGDTLRDFATELRDAVDSIDRNIRLGHCAVMSTYDLDGVDSFELARIFAGSTKPFLRLIGAPYWAGSMVRKLQHSIEYERMQEYWAREYPDIEIFAEGDVYPRPRYLVPSAYLEGFDTALRASGGLNGILKYALDYSSGPLYETGYTNHSQANTELYKKIENAFSGKTASGITVISPMKTLSDSVFPDEPKHEGYYAPSNFFRAEQIFLCDNSLPITYEGDGAILLFGESARKFDLSLLSRGVLLDIPAALILSERGVDVGLIDAQPMKNAPTYEHFGDTRVLLDDKCACYDIEINNTATVHSYYSDKVASYSYKNNMGDSFAVFAFDANNSRNSSRLFRNYCLQRLLIELVTLVSGKAPDAVCTGNPDLYIITKKNENSLTVGLWNFFADSILSPVIELANSYSSVDFINCSGRLEGNKIYLDNEIPAFTFAGIEVKNDY